ncbi:MAG: sugar transferase [Candidatus Moranbacteria bacterium]|nr:sugar transferase [Candidatus Moranbacteria bacterium]NTW45603.1 sugar transferase [Candidatus Moranbacteria bacterium]
MKRSEIAFSAVQVPVDYLMIVLAGISVFLLRDLLPQISHLINPKVYSVSFERSISLMLMVGPIFLLTYAIEGLYVIRTSRSFWRESFQVFKATSLGIVIIIIAVFLQRDWFSSRFIIVVGWFAATVYVSLARFLLRLLQRHYLVAKGVGVYRVLLVGGNGRPRRFAKLFTKHPELGYRAVDIMETASLSRIDAIRQEKGIDEIIVCDQSITDDEQEKILDYCEIHNIAFKYFPTTLQTSRFAMRIMNGEPLIEFLHTPLDGWGRVLKRIFDIVASSVAIVLLSPVMAVVAALIKLEDGSGPIVYKNERIGENGRKFFVYKFRYMRWKYCVTKENPDFEEALAFEKRLIEERSVRKGPLYKIKDDPRKTRVGAFIEKYSIDEFPQFFNVFRGEMSLVGPRPHQKREVEKYREYHRRLLTIKPGLTGMAQVSGRSDLAFEDEYRLDVYYIENWSLWLDMGICLRTVGALLARRKN